MGEDGFRPGAANARELPPRVKVCGITSAEDAELAVRCGASAIGFVFWRGSPRAVTLETARAISRSLPPFVSVVGVFVNHPFDAVLEAAAGVPLTIVQFHGDESDEAVASFPWRVIRSVALQAPGARSRLEGLPAHVTVLLDAHDPVSRGGTGRTIDWAEAARVSAERRVVLAGGLTPENVSEAVRLVQPWGLDVSSGVERAPGRKDAERLEAFMAAVRTGPAGAKPGV